MHAQSTRVITDVQEDRQLLEEQERVLETMQQ